MKNHKLLFCIIMLISIGWLGMAAAKSKVKGDPELLWRTPLGNENIENNAKNRCLLIKKVKPGAGLATETSQNVYELLTEYTANLYAQSVKITAYLEEETADEKKILSLKKADDEISIIKQKISRRLEDIARRINIINSLEAGTNMLMSLAEMTAQADNVYNDVNCDEL